MLSLCRKTFLHSCESREWKLSKCNKDHYYITFLVNVYLFKILHTHVYNVHVHVHTHTHTRTHTHTHTHTHYEHMYKHILIIISLHQGGDLFDAIIQCHHLTEATSKRITRDLGHALLYLHGKKIVHRDIKPENIFVSIHA